MKEKIKFKDVVLAILAILFLLAWIALTFGTYTERPDFATSPDEAIRTK